VCEGSTLHRTGSSESLDFIKCEFIGPLINWMCFVKLPAVYKLLVQIHWGISNLFSMALTF
jgi:hypothetical protein